RSSTPTPPTTSAILSASRRSTTTRLRTAKEAGSRNRPHCPAPRSAAAAPEAPAVAGGRPASIACLSLREGTAARSSSASFPCTINFSCLIRSSFIHHFAAEVY
uniref:Uncharacterized protein n=1 Tax=Aegilops tauschii subsp. strangulata TaxID=200361 RepID=A0A452XRS8_AEGTS